jgi:hypothetical protein
MQTLDCDNCNQPIVRAWGYPNAPYLFMMGSPHKSEWKQKVAGSGFVHSIIFREFTLAGISLERFYITHLWLHDPDVGRCEDHFISRMFSLMKGRKGVILSGKEFPRIFGEYLAISDLSGLAIQSPLCDIPSIYMTSVTSSMTGYGIGEMRLALKKFKKDYYE